MKSYNVTVMIGWRATDAEAATQAVHKVLTGLEVYSEPNQPAEGYRGYSNMEVSETDEEPVE